MSFLKDITKLLDSDIGLKVQVEDDDIKKTADTMTMAMTQVMQTMFINVMIVGLLFLIAGYFLFKYKR